MVRKLQHLGRSDSGQAAIETAVSLLVILPMLVWVLQMCMFCYTIAAFQYATRQGAEYTMTHGTDAIGCQGPGSGANSQGCDSTAAATKSVVTGLVKSATGQSITGSQVVVSWTNGTNKPGDPVTVSVTSFMYKPMYKVPWMTGFFPQPYINAQATGNVLF